MTKRALGVVVGAGAGGLLGREVLGGGTVGTVSGMLVGAIGAQALERRHERYGVSLALFLLLLERAGMKKAGMCERYANIPRSELDTSKPDARHMEMERARATATAKKG